jgi:hypothetical protein
MTLKVGSDPELHVKSDPTYWRPVNYLPLICGNVQQAMVAKDFSTQWAMNVLLPATKLPVRYGTEQPIFFIFFIQLPSKAVLRIRIQLDPYIICSPGSGSVYYIRIRIQQLLN